MPDITVFEARTVVTMNPSNPEGTHVAVRGGRILGVGSLDEVSGWGEYVLDDSLKDEVFVPGFIEAHGHIQEGAFWQFPYVGYFDRQGADGTIWKGCTSFDDVVDVLRGAEQALTDPNTPVLGWQLDPIYFTGERLTKRELDQVSASRPVFVVHASGHVATVNTATLRKYGITSASGPGVALGADGEPNGELHELATMQLCREEFGTLIGSLGTAEAVRLYGASARNGGVTTVTEMGAAQTDDDRVINMFGEVVQDPAFPARLLVLYSTGFSTQSYDDQVARALALRARSSAKLRFDHTKFLSDGSTRGTPARFCGPGTTRATTKGSGTGIPTRSRPGCWPSIERASKSTVT